MFDTSLNTPDLICSLKLWSSITCDKVRGSTVCFIILLKGFNNMLGLCFSKLVSTYKPTGSVHYNKKIVFLAISDNFLTNVCGDPVHRLEVHKWYCHCRSLCLCFARLQLKVFATRSLMSFLIPGHV